ncbi:MAG: hypothetical protein CMD80_02930 [Gammaproteobacteria bacterium]|nr:hypothetical protein [Gammaproteobacteria bacterium]|tara:strand:- start:26155 stop:26994 length:840 start_codon:yes stop_codon:yes gene_type:complete
MKALRQIFLTIFIVHSINLFSDESDKTYQEQSMLSVLYAQTSAEFSANNIQTYKNAKIALDLALEDKSWTAAIEQKGKFGNKKPAIILDVDETVLDNIPFQARTILKGVSYPDGWVEWAQEGNASVVAGAYDFLQYANKKGVKIFYVTNRIHILEDATRENLINLGLPFDFDKDVLLMRDENGWTGDKTRRRELISENYRILLMVGDQLTDFISSDESYVSYEQRKKIADKYSDMWGEKWFVITNPMYGRWEYSIYNNQNPGSEKKAIELRKKALRPKN